MFTKTILILSCIFVSARTASLPSYIQKCKLSDPELNSCLKNTATKMWPKFYRGDKTIHLATLDPLQVNFLNIDVDGNLSLNVSDSIFVGLKDTVFNEIKMDLDKKILDIQFYVDELAAIGNYRINGKILALPITGDGKINVTYIGGTYDYHLDFDFKPDKKGQDHIVIKESTLKYVIKRSQISLTNLFNNQVLSDHMNVVLNENWKEVDQEVGVKVGDGFGEVLTAAIQAMFKKVPWNDMIDQ